jgi:hypothetical protein
MGLNIYVYLSFKNGERNQLYFNCLLLYHSFSSNKMKLNEHTGTDTNN